MKISATDRDEVGLHSNIAYTLLAQMPPEGMFSMDKDGTVRVQKGSLDREVSSSSA